MFQSILTCQDLNKADFTICGTCDYSFTIHEIFDYVQYNPTR